MACMKCGYPMLGQVQAHRRYLTQVMLQVAEELLDEVLPVEQESLFPPQVDARLLSRFRALKDHRLELQNPHLAHLA